LETFDEFIFNETLRNPALSLEDALDAYIDKYSLRQSRSVNEPFLVTDKRTKLKVLEDSIFSNPENCDAPEIVAYIDMLRAMVNSFEKLRPEVLEKIHSSEKNL
jgi:hypothetical protein